MIRRVSLVVIISLIGLTCLSFFLRLPILLYLVALDDEPTLQAPVMLSQHERWFDDYYTVEEISRDTFAIGEPLYHQQNYSYLLVGETRAFLFDSGTPLRDVTAVVASLTDKPVTVTQPDCSPCGFEFA